MQHYDKALVMLAVAMAWLGTVAAAQPCSDPAVCGQNSGLVPFHKDAIHASLIWTKKSQCPKMLVWMRPSEYKPSAYLLPTSGGVFSGFNPEYIQTVQGGFSLGQLDRSGWSRYAPDMARENTQLIDVCGLQALIDAGKFTKTSIAALTDTDMALTDPFFKNAGFSKGLGYNIFCAGNVAGVDGRIYVIGGHDKGGTTASGRSTSSTPKPSSGSRGRSPACAQSGRRTPPARRSTTVTPWTRPIPIPMTPRT